MCVCDDRKGSKRKLTANRYQCKDGEARHREVCPGCAQILNSAFSTAFFLEERKERELVGGGNGREIETETEAKTRPRDLVGMGREKNRKQGAC